MANVHRPGEGNPVADWFHSLPKITQTWFSLSLLCTLAVGFGVVSPERLILIPSLVLKGEIWRLFTCFTYFGGFGFNTCISLYLLQSYSLRYETSPVNTGGGGQTADFAYLMLISALMFLVLSYFLNQPVLGNGLVFTVLYVWSKNNAEQQVSMYGFPIKAAQLPFVLIGLRVLMGHSVMLDLLGLVIGHIYYFLTSVMPKQNGKDYIHTPDFLIRFFTGVGTYVPPVATNRNNDNNRGGGGGGGWGARDNVQGVGGGGGPGVVKPPNANPGRGHDWGGGGHALGR